MGKVKCRECNVEGEVGENMLEDYTCGYHYSQEAQGFVVSGHICNRCAWRKKQEDKLHELECIIRGINRNEALKPLVRDLFKGSESLLKHFE